MTMPQDPRAIPTTDPTPSLGGERATDTISEPAPADPAPDVAELLRKAEQEVAGLKDAWLRARADLDNVRKQAANDVARVQKYAIERFASELLAVKDALESALASSSATAEALREGVELTLKQLGSAFEKAQITEIDPAGEPFDPHQHMAMTMVETGQPPNTVAQVFQKGYRLHDRVLRPALVAVARIPEARVDPNAKTPT